MRTLCKILCLCSVLSSLGAPFLCWRPYAMLLSPSLSICLVHPFFLLFLLPLCSLLLLPVLSLQKVSIFWVHIQKKSVDSIGIFIARRKQCLLSRHDTSKTAIRPLFSVGDTSHGYPSAHSPVSFVFLFFFHSFQTSHQYFAMTAYHYSQLAKVTSKQLDDLLFSSLLPATLFPSTFLLPRWIQTLLLICSPLFSLF